MGFGTFGSFIIMIRMLASHLVAAESALSFGEEVNAKVEAERITGPCADWMWLLASAVAATGTGSVAATGTGSAAVTVATATRIARRIAVQVRRAVASLTNRNIYKCIICNQ